MGLGVCLEREKNGERESPGTLFGTHLRAWREEKEDAARHCQEKREATRQGKLQSHTEAWNFAKRHPLAQLTSRRNPCTDA